MELQRHQRHSHEHLQEYQQGVRLQVSEVQLQVQIQQVAGREQVETLRHEVSQCFAEGSHCQNVCTTCRSGTSESSSEIQLLRQERDQKFQDLANEFSGVKYLCVQVVRLKQSYGLARLISRSLLPIWGQVADKNYEVLDSKIASGLKKIINVDLQEGLSFKTKLHTEKRFLTGRHVAWMIHEYFKVRDTNELVLDLNEIVKVELKNDNSLNTRWEETMIAMKKQLDEEILDNLLPSTSTVRPAGAIAVSVQSRYCSEG